MAAHRIAQSQSCTPAAEGEVMGPLGDIKVLEIAGLGAAPYDCMMPADMGADVIRVDRPGGRTAP